MRAGRTERTGEFSSWRREGMEEFPRSCIQLPAAPPASTKSHRFPSELCPESQYWVCCEGLTRPDSQNLSAQEPLQRLRSRRSPPHTHTNRQIPSTLAAWLDLRRPLYRGPPWAVDPAY